MRLRVAAAIAVSLVIATASSSTWFAPNRDAQANPGAGGPSFSIDTDPTVGGIQSTRTVTVGSTFNVRIAVDDLGSTASWWFYNVTLDYDDAELDGTGIPSSWSNPPVQGVSGGNVYPFASGASCSPTNPSDALTGEDDASLATWSMSCEDVSETPTTGSGGIVDFTFRCETIGTAALTLGTIDDTYLLDSAFVSYNDHQHNATITCGADPCNGPLHTFAGPSSDVNAVRTTHTITAFNYWGSPSCPAEGITVFFSVTSGPNAGATMTCSAGCVTNASGFASASYFAVATGTDTILATTGWNSFVTNLVAAAPHAGTMTTVAGGGGAGFCGDGGPAASSCLNAPGDVVADSAGNVYIADTNNHRVRRIGLLGNINTVAGQADPDSCGPGMGDGGLAQSACLRAPERLAIVETGGNVILFVSDRDDHRVRRIVDPHSFAPIIDTIAGDGTAAETACAIDAPANGPCVLTPRGIAVQEHPAASGDLYVFVAQGVSDGSVSRVALPAGGGSAVREVYGYNFPIEPVDVSISPIDGSLFVAEFDIRKRTAVGGADDGLVEGDPAETIVGVSSADEPMGIYVDAEGHYLIADEGAHTLLAHTPSTGIKVPFAGAGSPSPGLCGDGGFSVQACLDAPSDLFYHEPSEATLFADRGNNRVRKIINADQDGDGLLDSVEDPNDNGYEPGLETNEANTNTDGDACSDGEEAGANPVLGGIRNGKLDGLGQYDFYDVDGTKKVDAIDIGLVRAQFNVLPANPVYDRSPGANPWAPGPPNGIVNGIDIGLVRASFLHSCVAAP